MLNVNMLLCIMANAEAFEHSINALLPFGLDRLLLLLHINNNAAHA